jgi:hypothetical protein
MAALLMPSTLPWVSRTHRDIFDFSLGIGTAGMCVNVYVAPPCVLWHPYVVCWTTGRSVSACDGFPVVW